VRKVYYHSFYSLSRQMLVEKCIKVLNKGKKVIYILPSREAMFDVRQLFMSIYGGIADSYIFGFDDLEQIICRDHVDAEKIKFDNVVKAIIKQIINDCCSGTIFEKVKSKNGFIRSVYNFIKRLKRLNITLESFEGKLKSFDGTLRAKCEIIADIYKKYEVYKREKGLYDVDDISIMSCDMAKDAKIFLQTGIMVVDGFINIDPVNVSLLKSISGNFHHMEIYANIPYKNVNNDDFIKNEVLKELIQLDFVVDENVDTWVNVEPTLKLLADNLYSGKKVFSKNPQNIRILNSPCIEHEVREAARILKKKIIMGETVPERVAIYVKNPVTYIETIRDVFDEMGIPVRLNEGKRLFSIPLIKDLFSLMSYLIKEDEEDLEDLVSSKYLVPFEVYGDTLFELQELETEEHDLVTEKNSSYIFSIIGGTIISSESIQEFLKEFVDVLVRLDLRANIASLYKNGVIDGQMFIRDVKALDQVEAILNELIRIYEEHDIGNSEEGWRNRFLNELTLIFSATRVRLNVRDLSGVRVLNPDIAKGQLYDIVFILGVDEGVFPDTTSGNVLFDMTEDDQLYNRGINIINHRWELEREKIRFNLCLASAKKEVYISYHTSDEEGKYIIKSSFVDAVEALADKKVISKIKAPIVHVRDRFRFDSDFMSRIEVLRAIPNLLRKEKVEDVDGIYRLEWIIKQKGLIDKAKYINHAAGVEFARIESPVFDMHDGQLSRHELAQQDSTYGFSPSQLNSYTVCPFKYYSERVLGLSIQEEDEVLGAMSVGFFYHKVLKKYYMGNEDWELFDEPRLRDIYIRAAGSLDDGNLPQIAQETFKNELWQSICAFVRYDVDNFRYYREKTGYRLKPVLLEQPFKINSHGCVIKGVVDRVDFEVDEEGIFTGKFIIYDYKKSNIRGIRNCVEGKDFQLPVYYIAAKNHITRRFGISQPECIGLLYYSIEGLTRNGIVRSDMKKYLFKGNTGPRDLVGSNNLDVLIEWIMNLGAKRIDQIRQGKFNLPLICYTDVSMWGCEYSTICRYDKYRIIKKWRAGGNND
jgi:ATP-dependent helicase/nuclease subunit B